MNSIEINASKAIIAIAEASTKQGIWKKHPCRPVHCKMTNFDLVTPDDLLLVAVGLDITCSVCKKYTWVGISYPAALKELPFKLEKPS